MRRLALLVAVLALPVAVGQAQPPDGVVRPANEAGLSDRQLGAQLYAGNCASCHGVSGQGVPKPRPSTTANAPARPSTAREIKMALSLNDLDSAVMAAVEKPT